MSKVKKRKYKLGPDVDLTRTIVLNKDGKRLTNTSVEKIANSALKRVVGRPSLTADSVKSPQLKVRVPVRLKKALDKEARRRGASTSSLIREALEKFLKSA